MSEAEQKRLDDEATRTEMTADHVRRRRDQFFVKLAEANAELAKAEEARLVARQAANRHRGKGR